MDFYNKISKDSFLEEIRNLKEKKEICEIVEGIKMQIKKCQGNSPFATLYPFKFEPVYKDYIWGGRKLEKLGKKIPEGITAESWEISSHPDGESIIANGKYKGLTIAEIVREFGRKLTGNALSEKDIEKFPLLIKIIDAEDSLSVQVHPDDNYAGIHENGECGKNEMWYVISAKPGAKIVYGVKPGISKEIFENALNGDNIDNCLNYMEVTEGDAVIIPAGLIHAIGAGIVIVEIQQNSNTTYRVFDYNRTDKNGNKRPLNIKKALEVIDFNNCNTKGKLEGLKIKTRENSTRTIIVANKYFCVEKIDAEVEVKESTDGSRFITYVCLEGEGQIRYNSGIVRLSKGESVLIPAVLGEYTIEGKLKLLKAFVPDIKKDTVEQLLKAGYSEKEIFDKVIF